MKNKRLLLSALFLAICPAAPGNAQPPQEIASAHTVSDVVRQVLGLAEDKKFRKALRVLDTHQNSFGDIYEFRFAKARVLAWSGEYDKARQVYNDLLVEHPDNADVIVGLGYLEYYDDNLIASEAHFKNVLLKHPEYLDAQIGLRAVQKAIRVTNARWKLDTGASISSFSNGSRESWNHQFVRLERRLDHVSINAQLDRYHRFGLNDTQIQIGISSTPGSEWDWALSGGITPSANFRAKSNLSAGLGRTFSLESGTKVRAGLRYALDNYETQSVHAVYPELSAYFENDMVIIARAIRVFQDEEPGKLGWLVEAQAPVSERLGLRLGLANAPETINGVVRDTESYFAGAQFQLQPGLNLRIDASRNDRKNDYIRNEFNVGFSQVY